MSPAPSRSLVRRALSAMGFGASGVTSAAPRRARINAAYGGMTQDGRLLSSWHTPLLSANQELDWSLRLLRARARALVQNNGYAEGFVLECVSNIVGPVGVRLRAQNRTRDGKLATATNFEIERAWTAWNVPEYASVDGHDAWTDLEALIVRTLVVDGEVFYREVRGADNPFGYAVELIDPDLVDETYRRLPTSGQNEIRMGVELDARNRPVAYHVWDRHPSEQRGERRRIPATDLQHLFIRKRINQVRGVTWFAPVLPTHAALAFYEEAEVTAARWSASKLGVWTPGEMADIDENAPKIPPLDAPPGALLEAPKGYTLEEFDPKHPNVAFKDFVGTLLRGIARGLGVSSLTLTGDLSQANYSSMRAGLLPERDVWRGLQQWLIRSCHRRVFRSWLDMALLAGAVRVDSRLASLYDDVAWKPRGWQWVDPLKDVQALKERIRLGLDSRTRAVAEQGLDFEDVVDELHEEQEYADAEGVDISGADRITGTDTSTAADGVAGAGAAEPDDAESETDAPNDSTTGAHASPRLSVA